MASVLCRGITGCNVKRLKPIMKTKKNVTKKTTNLSQSGEVPKVGNGGSFGKKTIWEKDKFFHGKMEVRDGEVAMDRHFLLFHVLVSLHVP